MRKIISLLMVVFVLYVTGGMCLCGRTVEVV